MLWRMSAGSHATRIGSMAFSGHPRPATNVSATNVFRRQKRPALIALIAPTLRKGSVLGRELAPDQGCSEVAPGVVHLLDAGAGPAVDAVADRLPAQPLVQEAPPLGRPPTQNGSSHAARSEAARHGLQARP